MFEQPNNRGKSSMFYITACNVLFPVAFVRVLCIPKDFPHFQNCSSHGLTTSPVPMLATKHSTRHPEAVLG